MGMLENATVLRKDQLLIDRVESAVALVAREVIIEAASTPNHATRDKKANDVAPSPAELVPLMMVAVACDPNTANQYSTAAAVPEATILAAVRTAWNAVAAIRYPNG